MQFEYDPAKSDSNLEKHGISFDEAIEMWGSRTVEFPVASKGEDRFIAVGRIAGEYWTAVCTMRGERVRIISVRRSTGKERSAYDREENRR